MLQKKKKEQNRNRTEQNKIEETNKERMHGFLNALAVVYAIVFYFRGGEVGFLISSAEKMAVLGGSVLLGVLGVWRLLGVRVVGVARKSKIPFIAVSIVTFLVYTDHLGKVPEELVESPVGKVALVTGGNSGTGFCCRHGAGAARATAHSRLPQR